MPTRLRAFNHPAAVNTLTMHVAQQHVDDNKNNNSGDTTTAPLPRRNARETTT